VRRSPRLLVAAADAFESTEPAHPAAHPTASVPTAEPAASVPTPATPAAATTTPATAAFCRRQQFVSQWAAASPTAVWSLNDAAILKGDRLLFPSAGTFETRAGAEGTSPRTVRRPVAVK